MSAKVPHRFTAIALAAGLLGACQDRGLNEQDMAGSGANLANEAISQSGFAKMDSDGDGSLTAKEHASAAAGMFAAMDGDENGSVTAAEMDAAQSAIGGSSGMSSADKIKVVDTNNDGMLSRKEHVDGSAAMFAKMDGDSDGALTQIEFDAGHKAMMEH